MEPPASAEPQGLDNLRIDDLRRAVEIYLKLAYAEGDLPEAVRRRLDWDAGLDAGSLLRRPPFELAGKSKAAGSTIYALRLGNTHYPHMKLQIQPWPNSSGFMLSVNTHDQVLALDPTSSDMPAFRALQSENQRLKEVIEQAWDDAGLPTFLRYLRDYIQNRASAAADPTNPGPPGGPPASH